MNNNGNAKKIRLYYGIFLSVATVAVGLAFISQAVGIFADGGFTNNSYTREIVAKRLFPLSFVLLGYILAVIAGYVLSEIFAYPPKRFIIKDDRAALKKLSARMPENAQECVEEYALIARERFSRKITFGVCAGCCAVSAILIAAYVFNKDNFALATLNSDLVKMLYAVLPLLLFMFACAITATYLNLYSIKRELTAVKSVISKGGAVRSKPENNAETRIQRVVNVLKSAKALWIIRGALGVCALTFIIVGIFNGGAGDVLRKAINICMECIGLG